MSKYTPNWKDPRVVRRINQALDYAYANLSPTKPQAWGTRKIDAWFGNQGNPLSKMMREQLLIVDNAYFNPLTGVAKKYLLNLDGARTLAQKIGRPVRDIKQDRYAASERLFGSTLESGVFEYQETSGRLWNDMQFLDNATRKPLFANYGYVHEYDIKSAAPTLLYQYAKCCNLTRPCPTIEAYLQDPDSARQRLQTLLGIDRKTAKSLITSRFAGARFGNHNSIINQLDGRWILHDRLKNDPWYEQLSNDIKKLWDAIKKHNQLGRMTSREKWAIYFREETRVMRVVHRYLNKKSIKYFHEHDGWRATGAVDLRELQLYIKKHTHYSVDFDWEVYDEFR